jgi:hypothetical protein
LIDASSIRTGTPVSGLLPEGFGFGLPAPSLSESALFQSVSTIAAATLAFTIPVPNHTKSRSTMPSLSPTAAKITRVVGRRSR